MQLLLSTCIFLSYLSSFCTNCDRILMGKLNNTCDDGQTNLEVDWDGSPVNYTCYSATLMENNDVSPTLECDRIPLNYSPKHYCMNDEIHYDSPLPTHAGHRPIWPAYGEYTFIPPQRWSHNIEHGAIIMLAHPCADEKSMKKMKEIVKHCLYKHIISVSNQVPMDRPFVLVAWGCRLRMGYVDEKLVKNFIKTYALHGPEGKYNKNGQYNYGLIEPAAVPVESTIDDTNLCPK